MVSPVYPRALRRRMLYLVLVVSVATALTACSSAKKKAFCVPEFPRGIAHDMAHMHTPAVPPRHLAVLKDGTIDPNKVDLGGVPGVTLEEQHRAEALLRGTLLAVPKYKTVAAAKKAGFVSLGDSARCWEHYINIRWILNNTISDHQQPESLVYRVLPNGGRSLEAAMYELAPHTTLATAPDLGGKLTQWHIHNTLCFRPGSFQGIGQNPDGSCTLPYAKPKDVVPMIHVWIVPNKCGPFAGLDDILGGEVAPGQSVNCDKVHGT